MTVSQGVQWMEAAIFLLMGGDRAKPEEMAFRPQSTTLPSALVFFPPSAIFSEPSP